MKLSIIVPVYQDGAILETLYNDLNEKVFTKADFEYELIFVNDGSTDDTLEHMTKLKEKYSCINIVSLSRNFGAYSAVLCGLNSSSGDCAVVKAADLQEPSELILEMVEKWRAGNNVVLAVRDGRNEPQKQVFFSNLYYKLVRKFITPNMPPLGFDVFLIDKKVINVLGVLDERNSSLILQILWVGFKTAQVPYYRANRSEGKSKWTLKKKIRLVMDTFFSFSNMPIQLINILGCSSSIIAFIALFALIVLKGLLHLSISSTTILLVLICLGMGMILSALGILGEYLWRTLDASRNRPVYISEDVFEDIYRRK